MTLFHWLIVFLCIAVPALFLVWRRSVQKRVEQDRRNFMVNKTPDEDSERPGGFLSVVNAANVIAWRRRHIAAHPQTIVTQRFPSETLLLQLSINSPKWRATTCERRPRRERAAADQLPAFLTLEAD